MNRYRRIERCRICGSTNLVRVLDLGTQFLTGVFPRTRDHSITAGPLRLVKCCEESGCGLLQLEHSYELTEMYGDNYGYRSGLNASMVSHLRDKVRRVLARVPLRSGDLVVDIGSNDGTTLSAYPSNGADLVGIDPSARKFRHYYPSHATVIEDFFSAAMFKDRLPGRKARVVTSFAMFYDLEEPIEFMRQIRDILTDDGIWMFEQSYMPTMLSMDAYDTVCHEHLEFYGLHQIQWMAERTDLRIVDIEFNDTNGGSFCVTVTKSSSTPVAPDVHRILERERSEGLDTLTPYARFAKRVEVSRSELKQFVGDQVASGKTVGALGASTKGNVLLQFCGFTDKDIFAVGEVNEDKFGAFTPGSWLPIVPEQELLASKPDYLLVMPWHFRDFFLTNPKFAGTNLVFPLPRLEIVRR